MEPCLVFDIETIPDVAGLRLIHELPPNLSDADVVSAAHAQRRQASGSDFLQPYLQRVVAISCVLRLGEKIAIGSVGEPADGEAALITRFFDLFERYTPQVVSWNGGGFDFPVLHHRSLIHHVKAPRYWDWGDDDREFRYNNYLSRYHTRHLDLMEVLACYQSRSAAGLDDMDRRLLMIIIEHYDGGPVGIDTLAAALSEPRDTIEDVYEPFLLQQGYIGRTPRGRIATRKAYDHLGEKAPPPRAGKDQGGLFD